MIPYFISDHKYKLYFGYHQPVFWKKRE